MTQDEIEARAKGRYIRMSVVRITGMMLVLLGMQIWTKGAFGFQDEWVGKGLSVLGVACMLLFPSLMRKRWREADERLSDTQ